MSINLANRIDLVSIETLNPYEKNARLHDASQIEKLSRSIKEFGFTNPILVDSKKGIIAGHGRIAAAKKLGLEKVPVIVLDHLSEEQKRALVLADNRLAEDARWDSDLLRDELEDLKDLDFDLDLIGFSDAELDGLLSGDVSEIEPPSRFTEPGEARDEDGESGGEGETEDGAPAADPYTKKIKAPVYEIKGELPALSELIDTKKRDELLREIDSASGVSKETKEFLVEAAQRHNVFDYEKIAEFYAHQPPEVQELMENSALVIIDFNKAIENGFVIMTKEIAEGYANVDPE